MSNKVDYAALDIACSIASGLTGKPKDEFAWMLVEIITTPKSNSDSAKYESLCHLYRRVLQSRKRNWQLVYMLAIEFFMVVLIVLWIISKGV